MPEYSELFTRLAAEMDLHPEQGLRLWWSEVDTFGCVRCGQGCRQPWQIHVDPAYVQRWSQAFTELTGLPEQAIFQPTAQGLPALAKKPHVIECVMLDEQGLCRIHSRWGLEAKPEVCQRYPYGGHQDVPPDYDSPALALSCSRAARMLLEPQQLGWKWVKIPPGRRLTTLEFVPGRQLTRAAWLIWSGHLLDGLVSADRFSVWLTALSTEISRLLRRPPGLIGPADLEPLTLTEPTPLTFPERLRLLSWLKDTVLAANPALREAIPWLEQALNHPELLTLSPEEAALLTRYQQAFWQRQLLQQAHLLRGELNAVQQLYAVALQGILIRLWALYRRSQNNTPINSDRLAEAANQIYAFVIQDYSPGAVRSYRQLRPEICLIQLLSFARWRERDEA